MNIPQIINVDQEKCVNCHACIAVCPVKYCNNASGDYVFINHDMCIGCGQCMVACTHNARTGIDDFDLHIPKVKPMKHDNRTPTMRA